MRITLNFLNSLKNLKEFSREMGYSDSSYLSRYIKKNKIEGIISSKDLFFKKRELLLSEKAQNLIKDKLKKEWPKAGFGLINKINLKNFFIECEGKKYYTPLFLAKVNNISYFTIKNKLKKLNISIKAKDIGIVNSLSEELLVVEDNLDKLFYDKRFKCLDSRGIKWKML